MAKFLKPDNILTHTVGAHRFVVHQKIIPDDMRAPRNVAAWVPKGSPMKPRRLLGGNGVARGICVHNTNDITVARGTNAAEQYTRATFNGNMAGVVVHYYVWRNEIWQNLRLDEQGWHGGDGQTRRDGRRPGQRIGGNLDTIAIEAIGSHAETTRATALLCAWLCQELSLEPALDLWQHFDFSRKICPQYIRPHWASFVQTVACFSAGEQMNETAVLSTPNTLSQHTVVRGDTMWALAQIHLGCPLRWEEIAALNPDVVPERMQIGTRLHLPPREAE
ncbi:MAG: N-acetylmuramoyl-L-alanine amidase [Oscillospiraceae bacterium]|nr:N-acetylmuramoyl-L-alanine amidase [Oscillospiraceae bacterium]